MSKRRKDFLVFGFPAMGREEIYVVVDCLESGWLGTGPRVAKFEEEFKHYKEVSHSVAVNSCVAALNLSLFAAGLNLGDGFFCYV